MQKTKYLKQVIDAGIVSVIRADSSENAIKLVHAVVKGGIKAIELTYSVPQANTVISELVRQYHGTDVIIGAGTVLDTTSARLAIVAGAQFIVSPSFRKDVAKLCNLYQIPYIPGVFTPREAQNALEYGSEIIKLFPGDIAGVQMIKDLKGPFPYINVLPSGGVTIDNISEWIKVGAVAISTGGAITSPAITGNYEAVTKNAAQFVVAYHTAKCN